MNMEKKLTTRGGESVAERLERHPALMARLGRVLDVDLVMCAEPMRLNARRLKRYARWGLRSCKGGGKEGLMRQLPSRRLVAGLFVR